MASSSIRFIGSIFILLVIHHHGVVSQDYKEALTKSLLFFEAQRSGQLPPDQRVTWRGDSALTDGGDVGVDLQGGYYDAGDNVKFGLPLAYSVTLLSWGALEFQEKFKAAGEFENALAAIKWGTDYLIKAHAADNVLYVGVGDGDADHACWQRPEDMTTPRTAYKVDQGNPGSDVAGETAAALAAASLVFDEPYSSTLVQHAKKLFDFALNNQGKYSDSVSSAHFYTSSGFFDELVWAAAWLYRATNEQMYHDYLENPQGGTGGTRTMFSWDDKYVGAQILAAKNVIDGTAGSSESWQAYKAQAEDYICNVIQKGNANTQKSSGGMLWFDPWANLQYVTSASLAISVYANYLQQGGQTITCPSGPASPDDLVAYARSQVDYILGNNPSQMSYLVGYGTTYPVKLHHRGASIVSIKVDSTPMGCGDGFDRWLRSSDPDPNVLDGAIVGGPDLNDNYTDDRENFQQAEPATGTVAPIVGVLASLT